MKAGAVTGAVFLQSTVVVDVIVCRGLLGGRDVVELVCE